MQIFQMAILPALISCIISYLVTPIVIKFAWKFGLIDDPKKNKHPKVLHTKPIPRGGGLAIFIGIFITTLIFLPLNKHIIAILIGLSILLIMGLIDDKKNLNPYLRAIVQLIVALIPVAAGIGIAYISNPINNNIIDLSHPQINFFLLGKIRSIWLLSDTLAVIWIVYLMNAINAGAKGVDGQLSGVIGFAALGIAALALKYPSDLAEWPVVTLAMITSGAFFGFLPWHIFPQKIMPSFSGSMIGAFLLGILSILTSAKVGTLAIILALPLFDTGFVIIKRIISGKSPVWGDRGHLHHKLLDKANLSKKEIAYIYWATTAILGLVALTATAKTKLYTIIAVAIAILWFAIWLTKKDKQK